MRAEQAKLLDVLGESGVQFVIPPFQRVYSWTDRECRDLLEDVMRAGRAGAPHFLGTLLCSEASEDGAGIRRLQVIDGQQRLTTVTLMLLAFARHLAAQGGEAAQRACELRDRLLLCDGGTRPKLLPTAIDRDMLAFLLGLADKPEDEAVRLEENLGLLRAQMERPDFSDDAFWDGCGQLQVIAIELTAQDAPQEVFESLNSKGKRLAIEDLVRNAILLETAQGSASLRLYEDQWLPIENAMESVADAGMEELLCSWLASRHDEVHLASKSEAYPLLRRDLATRFGGSYERLLADLSGYVTRFAANGQFRRDQVRNMDRWLQGKPKSIISERKMFGD